MNSLINDIKRYFTAEYRISRNIVLFRTDEEEEFLKNFLLNKSHSDILKQVSLTSDSSLRDIINSCVKCDNVHEKKYPFGSGENKVMVVLHSPQLMSNLEKKMLRTESIDLMKKMIKSINLKLDECYITNLIKCDPKEIINVKSYFFSQCQSVLKKEIHLVNPTVIIVMGDMAPLRSLKKEFSDIDFYEVHHPITLIKNPDLKKETWNTLKYVITRLNELGITENSL